MSTTDLLPELEPEKQMHPLLARNAASYEAGPQPRQSPPLEDQLAQVIRSARDVAATAEELLRELAHQETAARHGRAAASPQAVALAPRLLAATQQQLVSVLAMLRTM